MTCRFLSRCSAVYFDKPGNADNETRRAAGQTTSADHVANRRCVTTARCHDPRPHTVQSRYPNRASAFTRHAMVTQMMFYASHRPRRQAMCNIAMDTAGHPSVIHYICSDTLCSWPRRYPPQRAARRGRPTAATDTSSRLGDDHHHDRPVHAPVPSVLRRRRHLAARHDTDIRQGAAHSDDVRQSPASRCGARRVPQYRDEGVLYLVAGLHLAVCRCTSTSASSAATSTSTSTSSPYGSATRCFPYAALLTMFARLKYRP